MFPYVGTPIFTVEMSWNRPHILNVSSSLKLVVSTMLKMFWGRFWAILVPKLYPRRNTVLHRHLCASSWKIFFLISKAYRINKSRMYVYLKHDSGRRLDFWFQTLEDHRICIIYLNRERMKLWKIDNIKRKLNLM